MFCCTKITLLLPQENFIPSIAVNASSFKTQVIIYHKSVFQESIMLLNFFSDGSNK